jgi:hypothetical protein
LICAGPPLTVLAKHVERAPRPPASMAGMGFGSSYLGGAYFGGVPLVQVASASVHASAGASDVVVTPRPDSAVPSIDVSLSENAWDLTTIATGVAVGSVFGHVPGAVVGGVALYAWGRLRWRQVQDKN